MGKNSKRNIGFNFKPKIAIVVDYLIYLGGAEQVLKNICDIFPYAPIYALFYDKKFTSKYFPKTKIKYLRIQKFKYFYRFLMPFYPSIVENINLDKYDIVISSGNWSKGIITKPKTFHIAYCHSPNRFLWEDAINYIKKNVYFGFRSLTAILFHFLRIWDFEATQRPDIIISNSKYTKHRIKKYYNRDSDVIYPAITKSLYNNSLLNKQNNFYNKKNYFLIVSRLQYYKNIDIIIDIFNKLGLTLLIAGDGRDRKRLQKLAKSNIKLLGFVEEKELRFLYKNAKALILPCVEDFGLTPIEAMSLGTPSLCFREGGALEYIIEGINGELFKNNIEFEQKIKKILNTKYNKKEIINSVKKFSNFEFNKQLKILINNTISK